MTHIVSDCKINIAHARFIWYTKFSNTSLSNEILQTCMIWRIGKYHELQKATSEEFFFMVKNFANIFYASHQRKIS